MFRDENEFDRLVEGLKIDTRVDPAHRDALRDEVMAQLDRAGPDTSRSAAARTAGAGGRCRMLLRPISAAAAVVIIGVGIVVVWLGGGSSIALADVQERLASAGVVAFELEAVNASGELMKAEMYVDQSSRSRMTADGTVSIFDWRDGRIVNVFPASRLAIVGRVENLKFNPYHRDWMAGLRRLVGSADAEPAGERRIGDVEVAGWSVHEDGWDMTVWADVRTAELVEVDYRRGDARTTMRGFRYDVEIDVALLEPVAPEGYQVIPVTADASKAGEADVAALLRVWALGNGGVFPDDLDAAQFSTSVNWQAIDWQQVPSPAELNDAIARGFWWLYWESDWTYAGAGVELGDAAAVFWYRPKEVDTYRVIFGDLRIEASAQKPRGGED
ncbi:MAG: hypothetical protein CMJ49_03365 [Planctomycetaceae bacterium]|nr:hypothetical protein [Planctomycetaceae bacterium]